MNVSLKQIAEQAAVARGLTKTAGAALLDSILTGVQNELVAGNSVVATGFGTFKAANRAARTSRNPRTGETIEVAAKRAPKFVPGKALKDAVKG